ncbi:MAG: hypothetical protein JW774_04425 [Candidatus Aureabacteria bacterium]|nr:hypothetical protein [Candidatus Auribacterota bacterium]
MTTKKYIAGLLICFLSFSVFAVKSVTPTVSDKDFALRLAKELNIANEIKGNSYKDIVAVFPENFQDILNEYKGEEPVIRKLAAEIFSYFLDLKEIDSLQKAGNAGDSLTPEEIDALFAKCSKEGNVLTYIVPPGHSFTNRLDPKLNELYQSKGQGNGTSGDDGYPKPE